MQSLCKVKAVTCLTCSEQTLAVSVCAYSRLCNTISDYKKGRTERESDGRLWNMRQTNGGRKKTLIAARTAQHFPLDKQQKQSAAD